MFLLSDGTRTDVNEYLESLENGTELIVWTEEQIPKLLKFSKRYFSFQNISYLLNIILYDAWLLFAYVAPFGKKMTTFSAQNIFFWCSIILFLSTWKTFLCYINFFVVDMKYFFAQHQHVFVETKLLSVNVKLSISIQNYFSCNTKFLFWASFIMLCHGDIFLLSHSNKNIIACQKVNKLSFLCDTKKLISLFLHHHFVIFSFYITHCQHVDLLCSGPGNKETFNHLLLTCLIYTEAVTK